MAGLHRVALEQQAAALLQEGVHRLQVGEGHGSRLGLEDEDHAERVLHRAQRGENLRRKGVPVEA